MSSGRDNIHHLSFVLRQRLAMWLRNPHSITSTHTTQRKIARTICPDVRYPTAAHVMDALGYLDITISRVHVSRKLPALARPILHHWRAHPADNYSEIARAVGVSISRVAQVSRELMMSLGFDDLSSSRRSDQLRFYDYMGWLDRDAMNADADALDRGDFFKLELFPSHMTETQHNYLYHLYMNPFSTKQHIAELSITSAGMFDEIWRRLGLVGVRRVEFFMRLGYVRVPYVMSSSYLSDEDLHIMNLWREHPSATRKQIAAIAGMGDWQVADATDRIYDVYGYRERYESSSMHRRLAFYWWMGWFDRTRLEADAQRQYKQLGVTS